MPLQAYNIDANGTHFHNMFSPKILSNRQCYLSSQIQTVIDTITNDVSVANNRYNVVSDWIYFLPEYIHEQLLPPASITNHRLVYPTSNQITSSKIIVNGLGGNTAFVSNHMNIAATDGATSNFGVFQSKAFAISRFSNSGTALGMPSNGYGMILGGVLNDPLFVTDLVNTRYNNHFWLMVNHGNGAAAGRLLNMTTNSAVAFRALANNTNYTFQCSADSGDGTTVSGLWATHIALVDNTAPPADYCIGTVPPIVLLGRGAYTLGNLYKFNNVGEGTANANAYDRWYIAGPTYGTGGDRLLMQVYYED